MNTLLSRIRQVLSGSEPRLRLYSMEYCYYCRKVVREAHRLGVRLSIVDIFSDQEGREHLRTKTGRTRVPVLGVLQDDGTETLLPESDDIIRYLKEVARKTAVDKLPA